MWSVVRGAPMSGDAHEIELARPRRLGFSRKKNDGGN
jgi:hypothetical protein